MKTRILMIALAALIASPAHADGERRRPRAGAGPLSVEMLANANDAARQRPVSAAFEQARQIYPYAPGALYELTTSPAYVSAILLEPGEHLTTIAAGDTARWMVSEAEGEASGEGRTIVLVKPQTSNLRTNIVLITDRRTYLIEALSRSDNLYAAEIAWSYPPGRTEESALPVGDLNFNYRIRTRRGRTPPWSPARVFDDGRKTYVEFADSIAASDMPPLFVITEDGAEIVNYRVQGARYIVDRLFDVAELRLGARTQTIVRIERTPSAPLRANSRRGPRS
jgi:type IV secretion system protein VirB9